MNYKQDTITLYDGYIVNYLIYEPTKPIARIIIVLGKNEILYKYCDFMEKLANLNYQVICYEHRGQGINKHLLKDQNKCHINNFEDYTKDLDFIINFFNNNNSYLPTFLVPISLGTAITLSYIKNYKTPDVVKGIVFVSPFLAPKSFFTNVIIKYVTKILLTVETLFFKEPCYFIFTHKYFKKRIIGKNANTHSNFKNDKYFDLYTVYPQAKLGGFTTQWLYTTIKEVININTSNWQIEIPSLFIIAQKDNIVDPNKVIPFIYKHTKKELCKLVKIGNSYHDILIEEEEYYNIAVKEIIIFLNSILKE